MESQSCSLSTDLYTLRENPCLPADHSCAHLHRAPGASSPRLWTTVWRTPRTDLCGRGWTAWQPEKRAWSRHRPVRAKGGPGTRPGRARQEGPGARAPGYGPDGCVCGALRPAARSPVQPRRRLCPRSEHVHRPGGWPHQAWWGVGMTARNPPAQARQDQAWWGVRVCVSLGGSLPTARGSGQGWTADRCPAARCPRPQRPPATSHQQARRLSQAPDSPLRPGRQGAAQQRAHFQRSRPRKPARAISAPT